MRLQRNSVHAAGNWGNSPGSSRASPPFPVEEFKKPWLPECLVQIWGLPSNLMWHYPERRTVGGTCAECLLYAWMQLTVGQPFTAAYSFGDLNIKQCEVGKSRQWEDNELNQVIQEIKLFWLSPICWWLKIRSHITPLSKLPLCLFRQNHVLISQGKAGPSLIKSGSALAGLPRLPFSVFFILKYPFSLRQHFLHLKKVSTKM